MKYVKKGFAWIFPIAMLCLILFPFYITHSMGGADVDQLLYLLVSHGQGADYSHVFSYILFVLPFVAVLLVIMFLYNWFANRGMSLNVGKNPDNRRTIFTFDKNPKKIITSIIILFLCVFLSFETQLDVIAYFRSTLNAGSLYAHHYTDPDDTTIVFPEKKQNLIYIVLESLNTNFSRIDIDNHPQNLILELENIASRHHSFSDTDRFGGAQEISGLTWTIASLVGQTSGINLKVDIDDGTYGLKGSFLPGVKTIGQILEENGYDNYFLMGSDADFGGRETFFETHGNYTIYDTKALKENGFLEEDYHVFWGMEDQKLFEFAKTELTKIASEDKPFNFSILTVDTHFMEGYVSEDCALRYDEPYANALRCSSDRVFEFVEWITRQPFYEDTTIILVGDHSTMNNSFLENAHKKEKTVFNTFINVRPSTNETQFYNRDFTVMDYFPTTLAALGVEIEGERLGLGTNLFSNQETLVEKFGLEKFNEEISRKSYYYEREFYR